MMYSEADPVVQLSMPTHDPEKLIDLGKRIAPLREMAVLVIGSGFMTHGLPLIRDWRVEAEAPNWSAEFDLWAKEALAKGDLETLIKYKSTAPGYALCPPNGLTLHTTIHNPRSILESRTVTRNQNRWLFHGSS